MAINLDKFKRDLERVVGDTAGESLKNISDYNKVEIGNAVIDEMKGMIAKGISPIEEFGRFEAYKGVGAAIAASQGLKGSAKKAATSSKFSKYPYSVQNKFPDKRERPVNLFLSGDFLNSLEARPLRDGVEIGFNNALSDLKESGHREGVNGQPIRPIIPQGGESFSSSIYRRIVDTVSQILRQNF